MIPSWFLTIIVYFISSSHPLFLPENQSLCVNFISLVRSDITNIPRPIPFIYPLLSFGCTPQSSNPLPTIPPTEVYQPPLKLQLVSYCRLLYVSDHFAILISYQSISHSLHLDIQFLVAHCLGRRNMQMVLRKCDGV